MNMLILDGKKLNNEIAKKLSKKIKVLETKPCLAIIQVGNDSASNLYIKNKINFADKIGACTKLFNLSKNVSTDDVVELVKKINKDKKIHGVIVQMPLPKKINKENVFNSIMKEKDVDGLSAGNINSLYKNLSNGHVPATARGVKTLLLENEIKIKAKKVVVVGRSVLVGKSVAMNLLNEDAVVTICHSKTENLKEITKSADVVIVAVGRKDFITDDFISEGQVIIDVGINLNDESNLIGDTNIKNKDILNAFSPVPGGVGPMTVASLFENLLDAYKLLTSSKSI